MKKSKKQKVLTLTILKVLLAASALAIETNPHSPELLQALSDTRQKQEHEENSIVRVIQQPVTIQTSQICSSVEQARQRIRDLNNKGEQKVAGNITVEAGHGDVTVEDNHGDINNSVNVQVVNSNDRKCF